MKEANYAAGNWTASTTTVRVRRRANWRERWPLRLIGVGVILSTDRPLRNLVRYFGTYWNVGSWTLAEWPVTKPSPEPTP